MAGIYIHIPFCTRKCYYCDFYSITDLSYIEEYVRSLRKEIELYSKLYRLDNYQINSIYLGGGTPSLMKVSDLDKIMNCLSNHFLLNGRIETSIEINPNSFQKEYIKDLRELGINRISIGIQSFNDEELRFLRRIHTSYESQEALDFVLMVFDNVNIDLIFGLPNQSIESWVETLKKAVQSGVQHISIYNLIYEQETQLYNDYMQGNLVKKSEDEEEKMYLIAGNLLLEAGFEHYEISNFAKEGKKCIHNIMYWTGDEYFGFGPSASGFINNMRYSNVKDLGKYVAYVQSNHFPKAFNENIDKEQQLEEYIMLRLRSSGINIEEFRKNFGYDLIEKDNEFIKELEQNSLIDIKDGMIKLTNKGYFVSNAISLLFLTEIEKKLNIHRRKFNIL